MRAMGAVAVAAGAVVAVAGGAILNTTTLAAEAASNNATDWTNGYGLPGFPTVGQNMQSRVFTN